MSDKQLIEQIIQEELNKHYPEDRPIIAQMMRDKITGTSMSRNDYKKLFAIRKKMRKARIKNEGKEISVLS